MPTDYFDPVCYQLLPSPQGRGVRVLNNQNIVEHAEHGGGQFLIDLTPTYAVALLDLYRLYANPSVNCVTHGVDHTLYVLTQLGLKANFKDYPAPPHHAQFLALREHSWLCLPSHWGILAARVSARLNIFRYGISWFPDDTCYNSDLPLATTSYLPIELIEYVAGYSESYRCNPDGRILDPKSQDLQGVYPR